MNRDTRHDRARPRRVDRIAARATAYAAVVLLLLLSVTTGGCRGSNAQDLKAAGFGDRNPVGVPPEAKLVQYRTGQTGTALNPNTWFSPDNLTFRPTSGGRAWVVDEMNGVVVYKTAMKARDELVVRPGENEIRLNKAYVYSRTISSDRGFLIYFAPDGPGAGATEPFSAGPTTMPTAGGAAEGAGTAKSPAADVAPPTVPQPSTPLPPAQAPAGQPTTAPGGDLLELRNTPAPPPPPNLAPRPEGQPADGELRLK